jgi:gluconolactonase
MWIPEVRNPLLTRRDLLRTGLATGVALAGVAPGDVRAEDKRNRYEGLDTDKYLGKVEVLAKVKDKEVFTEGPAVDRAGNVFFTNVYASKILRYDPKADKLSVFRTDTHKTNGLYFDPQGRLLACEGDAGRVTRTDMKTGKVEVLAGTFRGKPFAPPNDLCMDGKGRIYFTSRPGPKDPSKGNVNAVYRIDPDGKVTQLLHWPDVHMPNGIVTSPDDRRLYLIEAHPDADHHRDIRVFDLKADGSLANERVLINFYPGRSGDGMCIDAKGNLYVAAGLHKRRDTSETLDTRPGIHVISPEGKLLAFRETPEDTLTNCTFGGEDLRSLYIACGSLLLKIRTRIPGKPSYRPMA